MATPKQELIKIISRIPDDAELEEVVRIVTFWAQIETAHQQALRGQGISNDEVVEELRRWAAERDIVLQD